MKKLSLLSTILVVVFTLLFISSCKKDTNLQSVKSALTMVMDNSSQTLLKNQKTVVFDSGYVYVTKVDVYGEIENEDEMDDHDMRKDGEMEHMETDNETYFQNTVDINTRINLLTGGFEVPIEFDILQTNYDDLKFFITLNSNMNVPAIEVYGTYYDINGNAVPVVFVYNDSVTIKVEYDRDDDNIDEDLVVTDSVPAFTIVVSPSKWFKDVSSEMLEQATRYNGVILINDTANVNILNEIIPNIGKECELHEENRERWENEYHHENMDD